MDFRQLECFEAVARAGSLSQAAKTLGMTQPALSAAIAKLENELSVQLLNRSANGVEPTTAGKYLLRQGGRLIASRNRVTQILEQMGNGLVGELHVAAEPMVIHELIAQAVADFTVDAPDIKIRVTDENPRSVLESVGSGRADIGCLPFSPEHIARPIAEQFEWFPLRDIRLKLAVPAARAAESHPNGRGWGRWILPHRLPGLPGMVDAVEVALAGDASFDTLFVSNPQTAIPFVAAGLGVSPSTEAIGAHHSGVALVKPPMWLKPMQITMLIRKREERTPVLERWISHVQLASQQS